MSVLWCDIFYPLCELSEYTVVGTARSPTLTVSMPASGPGVFQELSPGHQHRSTEVRPQDCNKSCIWTQVGHSGDSLDSA